MATKTRLGGVFMKDTDGNLATGASVSTENICGLIFDISGLDGVTVPEAFANGNVVELNTSNDLKTAGIEKDTMFGLPFYHIKTFFSLAGQNQRLFVSFMDSSTDTNFSAVELMQTAANGLIYQIGVWTCQPTASKGEGSVYTVTGLHRKLQDVAEVLGGKIGTVNYDGNSPLNILLNAPVAEDLTIAYNALPDISSQELPKVSHLLGQAATDEVHEIQGKLIKALGGNKLAVVGNIGAALGAYAVAPAEMSIAYTKNFNLSSVMQSCELGFGAITMAEDKIVATSAFNNLKSITYTNRQNNLHAKGYVFLTPMEGIENGVFFSSDQTLSTGDYRTVSRCRVMHKSRRVVRQALLSKVNAPVLLDSETGEMSSSDITNYQNAVLEALDNNMVEPGTKVPQISGRSCSIDPNQNVLENDQILIEYGLVPVGCTSAIYVTEGFAGSVSE